MQALAADLVEGEGAVSRHSGKAVLCIGNDPVCLNRRCSLLRQHGWHVISSGSGHEGLIRFGQERVDVVVLDLNSDGTESALIAGQLNRLRPDVPVIMLVPDGNALAPGATDLADLQVLKSQETDTLLEALKSVRKAS